MQEVQLLTKSDLDAIVNSISALTQTLNGFIREKGQSVYTNETLSKELKVSIRTLQHWRDHGLINFSKVGRKIFYGRKDVEKFLFESSNELFDEGFGRRKSKTKRKCL